MSGRSAASVAKAPVAGRAKTRLGAAVGDDAAADVAAAALLDTLDACARVRCGPATCPSRATSADAVRGEEIWAALAGGPSSRSAATGFAERLVQRARRRRARRSVVQIGMDTPQVTAAALRRRGRARWRATTPCSARPPTAAGGCWPCATRTLARAPAWTYRCRARRRTPTPRPLSRGRAHVSGTPRSLRDVDDGRRRRRGRPARPDLGSPRLALPSGARPCDDRAFLQCGLHQRAARCARRSSSGIDDEPRPLPVRRGPATPTTPTAPCWPVASGHPRHRLRSGTADRGPRRASATSCSASTSSPRPSARPASAVSPRCTATSSTRCRARAAGAPPCWPTATSASAATRSRCCAGPELLDPAAGSSSSWPAPGAEHAERLGHPRCGEHVAAARSAGRGRRRRHRARRRGAGLRVSAVAPTRRALVRRTREAAE